MNQYRRSLTALLITLSCLFAIQPAAASAAVADADVCTNIGPAVFSLGVGNASSGVMLSAPACYAVEADSAADSDESMAVRVPIEGSLMTVDQLPAFVIAAEHNLATATTGAPDVVRGQSSRGGPVM